MPYFLQILLLAESKSAKALTLLLIKSLTADSKLFMDKEYAKYLLDKTKNDYNLIAEDFSRTREKIWEETRFLFDNYLKEDNKVLDLGCGTGRYAELFKDRKIEYIGADIAEEQIRIARKKHPEAKFQTIDFLNFPFSDNHFDKIYSIAVFHCIPSKEYRIKFLKEVKRILKKDGLLILTVWKSKRWNVSLLFKYTILKLIGKSKLDFRDFLEPWADKTERYYHWFSKRELSEIVKKAGFKIKETGVIKNKTGNRQNIYLVAKK